jgi:hypothetical protein
LCRLAVSVGLASLPRAPKLEQQAREEQPTRGTVRRSIIDTTFIELSDATAMHPQGGSQVWNIVFLITLGESGIEPETGAQSHFPTPF